MRLYTIQLNHADVNSVAVALNSKYIAEMRAGDNRLANIYGALRDRFDPDKFEFESIQSDGGFDPRDAYEPGNYKRDYV